MSRRAIGMLLIAGAVATVVEAITIDSTTGDVFYFLIAAPLCVLTWWAALRPRPDGNRVTWALLALMQTVSVAGDLVQTWQFHHGGAPLAGPSDVLWLSAYPVQTIALIRMARRRAPGQLRAAALDALTLTTAAAVASYLFFVEPLFQQGRLSLAETVVPAAYPLGDLVFLAGVLVLTLSPGRRGGPTRLLLLWASISLLTNLGYNILPYVVDGIWADRLGALALFANVVITAVVMHAGRGELTTPGPRSTKMHPARGVFLGVAMMTAPATAVVHSSLQSRAWLVVLSATGVCAGLVVARFMIAVREQEGAQAQLAYQARHDPLTGLANRALLGEHLDREGPAVLLYLDLDGFKAVNDAEGHDAGDAVLVAVADRLSRAVRAGDVVARLGGDEFVVACPGATVRDGIALAERILHDVAVPVPFHGALLSVGASIGIAVREPGPQSSPLGALRSADEAMYRAKRLGRGRWILAG
ncbi:diguanylate cyclase [Actinoplanes sp. CA-030573]|uniref:diguanylate cyclase n=1 Tax=Actinoplanes sp. CA-030573 TaxID=3239898 RepID=UPI003D926880